MKALFAKHGGREDNRRRTFASKCRAGITGERPVLNGTARGRRRWPTPAGQLSQGSAAVVDRLHLVMFRLRKSRSPLG